MKRKIWVLGSSNIDVTYRVKEIPLKGYTVQAASCVTLTGGKGANQAAAAAHWGADVGFIGAIGDDSNGKKLLEVFRTRGIDDRYVTQIKDIPSGNAVILVDDKGGNCITVYPGANQCIPTNIYPDFNDGDILVTQLEININAVIHFFKLARQKNVYTILNPSPYHSISKDLLQMTDMVIANEAEAFEMGGLNVSTAESAKKCGERIMELGPSAVVITMGKQGVMVMDHENALHIPEYYVEVIDTQGAGDAFLGTFAAKIAQNSTLEAAALFANMIASLTVSRHGSTQVSLPDNTDIKGKNPGNSIKI